MDVRLNDILVMKKPHPCGSRQWLVLRTGADFRMRCTGCGHEVMQPRFKIEKNIKNILCDLVQKKENPYADVFSPSRSILLAINALESTIGLLSPTVPRCPHLGGALKYNEAEHSWDCPCHGSRFDEDGTLLDGPANGDKHGLN